MGVQIRALGTPPHPASATARQMRYKLEAAPVSPAHRLFIVNGRESVGIDRSQSQFSRRMLQLKARV